MKTKLIYTLLCIIILANGYSQSVGIGTTTPNSNAALEVSSNNKGILLPRLADTNAVANPSAGLFIFNQQMGSPNFHDGARWYNLEGTNGTNSMQPADSVTYTIPNTGPSGSTITAGTFGVINFSHSGFSQGGLPQISDVSFLKPFDSNSMAFKKILTLQIALLPSTSIEFKFYHPGSNTPYFSVKLTSWKVTQCAFTAGNSTTAFLESITLSGNIIGFKDWVTNTSFAWDKVNLSEVTY